jgi:hypothetical protein
MNKKPRLGEVFYCFENNFPPKGIKKIKLNQIVMSVKVLVSTN